MIRLPPRSTRTDTLFPYTTLFRSRKVAVLHGATADEFIVSAQTVAGLSLFLVPASASGLRIVEQRGYDGIPIAEIALDDVTVTADSLLGGAGSGAGVLERDRKSTRLNSSH